MHRKFGLLSMWKVSSHSATHNFFLCAVLSCFHNPPNSDMDYRVFNVRMWSFVWVRIHTGVGHTAFWLRKTLTIFSCDPMIDQWSLMVEEEEAYQTLVLLAMLLKQSKQLILKKSRSFPSCFCKLRVAPKSVFRNWSDNKSHTCLAGFCSYLFW